MKQKMYICRSKGEVEYFFDILHEQYPGIIDRKNGIKKVLDKLDDSIYLFNEYEIRYDSNCTWAQCNRKHCIDCRYDCFNDCEVIEVKPLLRTKKLERICDE